MGWDEDFSEEDYQHYWSLAPEERQQMLRAGETSEALRALLLYQQGQQWREKKDWVRAIDSFDAALEARPLWHDVWIDRAAVLLQVGDHDAAIASADRALELDPTATQAWSIRGAAFYRLKRYRAAADSCDRALSLDGNNYQAWRTLSDALSQLGRYTEAIDSYDQALAVQPNDPAAWGERGTALQKLGRYEEAIASYDRLLEAEPSNYKLWHQRGLALRHLGRVEGAVANFNRALEIQPNFYGATRSKLFLLVTTGQIVHYFTGARSPVERQKLLHDLRNVFDVFVKTKLPALVVLALVALSTTHDRGTAVTISAIFLLIAIIADWMTESRK